MGRRGLVVVIAGTFVALLFMAISSAGEVRYAVDRPGSSSSTDTAVSRTAQLVDPIEVAASNSRSSDVEIPAIFSDILRALFFLAILVSVAAWCRLLWRRRSRWRQLLRRRPTAHMNVLDDVAMAMAADADIQRFTLRSGTPRNAIVECWLRLEAAVVKAGVHRRDSDTATELATRVLGERHVDPGAVCRLAALYGEARFSEHPMTESSRHDAIVALDEIHRNLAKANSAASGAR